MTPNHFCINFLISYFVFFILYAIGRLPTPSFDYDSYPCIFAFAWLDVLGASERFKKTTRNKVLKNE